MPEYRITTDGPDGPEMTKLDKPNEEAAAAEAQRGLADMAHKNLPDGERLDMAAKVTDEAGKEVYRASLDFKAKWPEQIDRPKSGG